MPLTKARLKVSEYSQHRKKRVQEVERKSQIVTLSLTSMVDLFAVLVIYLLLNSGSLQEWVDLAFKIDLPKANANWVIPERAATIQVSKDMIIGGRNTKLTTIQKVLEAKTAIPEIKAFLSKQKKKNSYVNVVADYHIPFQAMRKIVATCQESGFERVNLAVQPGTR